MEVVKHRHTYTNWYCPYFDVDEDFMRETCSRCGKIKSLGWRYMGRKLQVWILGETTMTEFIYCPICEEKLDLEVSYPHLEMVGHFNQSHAELKLVEREDWSEFEWP